MESTHQLPADNWSPHAGLEVAQRTGLASRCVIFTLSFLHPSQRVSPLLLAPRALHSCGSFTEFTHQLPADNWSPHAGLEVASAHGVGLSVRDLHRFILLPPSQCAPSPPCSLLVWLLYGAAEEALVPPHQGNRGRGTLLHPHHLEHLFLHRYLTAGLLARPQS